MYFTGVSQGNALVRLRAKPAFGVRQFVTAALSLGW
jgi:hypothetical protein